MERYLEERLALETKYSDLCEPLYGERGNVFDGHLDGNIERMHKEGGGENEEEGLKGSDDGNIDAGEGEDRERDASLEDASNDDEIYSAVAYGQGTNTNNPKAAKDDDDEEGRMVGIPQFWVCAMGHMEAIAKLITERDIECLEHLTGVTFRDFEEGNVTKV